MFPRVPFSPYVIAEFCVSGCRYAEFGVDI